MHTGMICEKYITVSEEVERMQEYTTQAMERILRDITDEETKSVMCVVGG